MGDLTVLQIETNADVTMIATTLMDLEGNHVITVYLSGCRRLVQ